MNEQRAANMSNVLFPPRVLFHFIQALSAETGAETLKAILSNSALPPEWADAAFFVKADSALAARAYSQLQAALRLYYGRGARGVLFRAGSELWRILLRQAGFGRKIQFALLRALPVSIRRKKTLDALAEMLSGSRGDLAAYTHDLDLLLVDRASPTALNQTHNAPICFVTLGVVREALFWADGLEHDVEETACRAAGASQCEFKITFGG